MLLAGWLWLCAALCSLLLGQAEAPNPGVPPERSRPYAVLRGQNLGNVTPREGPLTVLYLWGDLRKCLASSATQRMLMGTIFSILLVTIILMAFCVYKPIRRR
ncbi:uncharacterized protein C12orf76 homolog [Alexandromys fortis]|uniref:uncharacterized protein C12orf76 homolog n=1 Tax=Alexandromys fortis TaxID=100897 RepID=UPI0021539820|nr:uncharacterized protein C12orf76 homolog [Microtus fortis]